ncbi:MAG: phospho-sugar mutase [Oscillospiraceae bacterium]|jgi:phosphoglucomutase|nr:phospho-sugar mutase [Oscillospiraceae bacterium]
MLAKKHYDLWLKMAKEDIDLVSELRGLNKNDINLRFSENLNFGTAGIRAIMGVGTGRINIYTIRRITQGLCNYFKKNKKGDTTATIAFDPRNKSKIFAQETVRVLCANSVKVFFNDEIRPTPFLSFCVRKFTCDIGIMITASHNPIQYNGYKCYGTDGSQITDSLASKIYDEIKNVDFFETIKIMNFKDAINSKYFEIVNKDCCKEYIECVENQSINKDVLKKTNLKVVYTPLNGCGLKFIKKVLKNKGLENLFIVEEQKYPDSEFKTCKNLNPESEDAFSLAVLLAKKKNADLILATDPDSDRIGVKIKNNKDFITLTGNQIGALMLNYILKSRRKMGTLPKKAIVIKSIVSTPMADLIAAKYDCKVIDVLTGFKYIGKQILHLELEKKESDFLFAFEESCGYLLGTYVRDKDAVVASMIICEMSAYYKSKGQTLIDKINHLYRKYGFHIEKTISYKLLGNNANNRIKEIMETIRNLSIKEICGRKFIEKIDFLKEYRNNSNFPKSNVIMLKFEDNGKIIIRPSGTESKIKAYIMLRGKTFKDASKLMKEFQNFTETLFKL